MAEWLVQMRIERLPEGCYLATSDEMPGLVAQGSTVTEAIEIVRDVAKKLREAQIERGLSIAASPLAESFELPLVLSA